jgi:hypothetical protein
MSRFRDEGSTRKNVAAVFYEKHEVPMKLSARAAVKKISTKNSDRLKQVSTGIAVNPRSSVIVRGQYPDDAQADYVSRLRDMLRNDGSGSLITRGLRKTVGSVLWFERVAFYEADLSRKPVQLSPLGVDVYFIVATADELFNCRAVLEKNFDLKPQEVERRLENGHVALLAMHDGRVVAMLWLAFHSQRVSEIGKTMMLRPGEVLAYNEETLLAWRGYNISPHLNQFADAYARQRSARRRINWRRLCNAPALRVAEKLEDRRFSVATTIHVMGTPRTFVVGLNSDELLPLVR